MQMSTDITFDTNFIFLQLIQRLANDDASIAAALIGVDQSIVERILSMTTAEQLTLARSSQPILKLRFDSIEALETLVAPKRVSRLQGLHGAICMASPSMGERGRL